VDDFPEVRKWVEGQCRGEEDYFWAE